MPLNFVQQVPGTKFVVTGTYQKIQNTLVPLGECQHKFYTVLNLYRFSKKSCNKVKSFITQNLRGKVTHLVPTFRNRFLCLVKENPLSAPKVRSLWVDEHTASLANIQDYSDEKKDLFQNIPQLDNVFSSSNEGNPVSLHRIHAGKN